MSHGLGLGRGDRAGAWPPGLVVGQPAPVLSDPTGVATSDTGATAGATTDKATGTLYCVVSRLEQPTAAQIVAGLNATGVAASASASLAITTTGAKTLDLTGLTATTSYYAYLVHVDVSGQYSNVVASDAFTTDAAADTTAPSLSSAQGTSTGTTTATAVVTTDEGNGTLYWFVSTSATPPSAADLKNAVGATQAGSQDVTTAGVQTVGINGLTAATQYYCHFLQDDASLNESTIASGSGFTTSAAGAAPVNNSAPVIAGTAETGSVATITSLGTWTGATTVTSQWQRETGVGTGIYANIVGQTGSSYAFATADLTLRDRLARIATNSNGSTTAYSNALGPVTAGSGSALISTTLERLSGATTYPADIRFDRPMEWQDGDFAVMQRSQDATFATGVTEATQTLYASTLTYDFGVASVTSGSWFFRLAAYNGTRPGSLNWSNVVNVGDVVPPLLSVTSTTKDDLGPLADVIGSDELGFFALDTSYTDSALLELSTYGADNEVTVRLIGDANLNAATKSSYSYGISQTDYAGNVSSVLTRSLTITAADTTPDAFTFTDITGAATSTVETSNTITVAGLGSGVSVAVSITGGTYSKNGGGYTSSAGTAQNGDTFAVRQTSSSVGSTQTDTTLTIGTVSDTYSVTTSGFTPGDLWTGSESGDWWAVDLSSMWQDTAGTVPAAVNQPVKRWVGKKNGTALTPNATNGPTLRSDGTNYYLEFVTAGSPAQALKVASLQVADATTGEWTLATAPNVPDTTTRWPVYHDDNGSNRIGGLQQTTDASARGNGTSLVTDAAGATVVANTSYTHIGVRTSTTVESFFNNTSNGSSAVAGTAKKTAAPLDVATIGSTYYALKLYAGVIAIGRAINSTERGNLHTWLDARN